MLQTDTPKVEKAKNVIRISQMAFKYIHIYYSKIRLQPSMCSSSLQAKAVTDRQLVMPDVIRRIPRYYKRRYFVLGRADTGADRFLHWEALSSKNLAHLRISRCQANDPVLSVAINTLCTTLRRYTIRYELWLCYFNSRSKANIGQLNLPHGTNN